MLSLRGHLLLGQVGAFCLKDLARHNRIEHDASLVHDDTKGRDEYAPISPDLSLVKELLLQAKDGHVLTAGGHRQSARGEGVQMPCAKRLAFGNREG
jgi:hypothetical protein